jgi:hypothetical protein
MEFTGFSCRFCFERREWDNLRVADAAAVCQLFDAHPVRWFAIAGDTVPTDPPTTRPGHRPVGV